MYLSEEKAKEKWCPTARAEGSNVSLRIKDDAITSCEYIIKCTASGCMMWRRKGIGTLPGAIIDESVLDGYCGLAGRPS